MTGSTRALVAYKRLFASEDAHAIRILLDVEETHPIKVFLPSEDVYSITQAQEEFDTLALEWKEETAHLSSPSMIAAHYAYQKIIGMGREAIPLILQDLKESKAHWFWALRSIARESPIRPEDRGDVDAMTNAWLDWGKRHRYI